MRALYIVLLLGLFFWGYRLCKKNLCPSDNTSTAATAVIAEDCDSDLHFKDGENLDILSDENFSFDHSSEELNELSDDFATSILDVVDYLMENTDRVIQIQGYYLDSEDSLEGRNTLGYARAKEIAKYFNSQGVSRDQVFYAGIKSNNLCVRDSVLMQGCSIDFAGKE